MDINSTKLNMPPNQQKAFNLQNEKETIQNLKNKIIQL